MMKYGLVRERKSNRKPQATLKNFDQVRYGWVLQTVEPIEQPKRSGSLKWGVFFCFLAIVPWLVFKMVS